MMQQISGKKKLTWLLILQGWTMLWVIIGHAPLAETGSKSLVDMEAHRIAGALFSFAYSFHMPLFIMISGYLFNMTRIEKGWEYSRMLKEKWIRLGIPYLVFITLALILKVAIPGEVQRQVELSIGGILMNYIDPFNGALQEMWFVAVIFIYFMLYPLYPLLLKSKKSMSIYGLATLGLYLVPTSMIPHILVIDRAVHFFIFFYAGLVISRLRLEYLLGSWGVIVGCVLGYILGYICNWQLLTALGGSFAFWGLAVKVDRIFTNNLFSSFRNYTYQIFLIGIFVQMAVKTLAAKISFTGSYPVWWMVCVFGGIFVPVGIAMVAERTGNKYIKRVLGL